MVIPYKMRKALFAVMIAYIITGDLKSLGPLIRISSLSKPFLSCKVAPSKIHNRKFLYAIANKKFAIACVL